MSADNLHIQKIETDYNVKVLFACDAGSKAWGLASPYSDNDLGLIYCKPLEWYLSVSEKTDIIDLTQHTIFDGFGWDLQKTLRLMLQSNAVLFDWLQSPVVYTSRDGIKTELEQFAKQCFDKRKVIYHYLGLGNKLIHKYKTLTEIPLKAYLLLIRSTLAAIWIKEQGTPPPVLFSELLPIAESQPKALIPIHQFVMLKKQARPNKEVKKIQVLDQFITEMRRDCSIFAEALPIHEATKVQDADKLFTSIVLKNTVGSVS